MAIKETKSLEPQELESLKELRSKVNTLTFKRGQLGLSEEVDDFAAGADAPEEGGVTERIPTNQVAVTTSPSADLEAQATHHGFEFDEHGNLVITGKKPEEKKTGSIMDLTDE